MKCSQLWQQLRAVKAEAGLLEPTAQRVLVLASAVAPRGCAAGPLPGPICVCCFPLCVLVFAPPGFLFGLNKTSKWKIFFPGARQEAVCEIMLGAVCPLGLFVLGSLHMSFWLLDAQPLPPTCVGWDLLQRIAWRGSGRAHDAVYPFLLNF